MNIKELRLKFKLSQQQLSEKVGIPKGRINSWEQRNTIPKVEDYKKLENFFNTLQEQMFSDGNVPFDKKEVPFDNFSQVQEPRANYSNQKQDQGSFFQEIAGITKEVQLQERLAFLEQRLKDKEELITELKYTIAMQKEAFDALKANFPRKDNSTFNTTTQKQQ